MTWLGNVLLVFGCAMTLGCAASLADEIVRPAQGDAQVSSGRTWALKLPEEDKVEFHGELDFDGVSVGTNSMLYPAPNVAGFLAAVITHGVLVESQKNSQRRKAQESANKVLEPYQRILDAYTYRQLVQPWLDQAVPGSSKKLIGNPESPGSDDWLIETVPVFLMAQDQRTIILDNLVSIHAPGMAGAPGRSSHIRVISPAETDKEPAGTWTADEGKRLKEVSAWLFSESLKIAMNMMQDGPGDEGRPFRTIRYLEGSAEKMERAQLISEQCGRLLIKTLRGTLMSVPVKVPTPATGNTPEMMCSGDRQMDRSASLR